MAAAIEGAEAILLGRGLGVRMEIALKCYEERSVWLVYGVCKDVLAFTNELSGALVKSTLRSPAKADGLVRDGDCVTRKRRSNDREVGIISLPPPPLFLSAPDPIPSVRKF